MRPDGSDLPRGGGVAKALRDKHAATLSVAMSNSSSFLYNDAEPFNDTYYVAYSAPALSSSLPGTCQSSRLVHIHPPSPTSISMSKKQKFSPIASSLGPQQVLPSPSHMTVSPCILQRQSPLPPELTRAKNEMIVEIRTERALEIAIFIPRLLNPVFPGYAYRYRT
jgi:hypothetical protein